MNDLTIQSAARYFLNNVAARLLALAGGSLVTLGVATNDQIATISGPLTNIIVGGGLLALSAAEAWWRARAKRTKELDLRATPAAEVAVK